MADHSMLQSRDSNSISLEKAVNDSPYYLHLEQVAKPILQALLFFQTLNVPVVLASMALLRVRHDAAAIVVHARLSSPWTTANTSPCIG